MKNIIKFSLSLFMVVMLMNCNDRNEEDLIQSVDRVKIDSVKVAQDSMDVFTTQTIKTFSNYSTKCEGFYGYDYVHSDELTRTVSAFKFKTAVACGEEVVHASQINFRPQQTGNYTFKFWNGTNSAGENIWIEKTIKVK